MRSPPGWSLALILVACDAPQSRCEDAVHAIGALCWPDSGVVRVGYGFAPTAMATADVDADGAEDLVGASPAHGTLTIAWGPGPGDASTWSIGEEIAGLAVADVDGDGRLDVATALPASDAVAVLLRADGRTFVGPVRMAAGDTPRAVVAAQLDGEAGVELVTANAGGGSVSVLRGGDVEEVIVGPGPHALAAGDVDGDGAMDVAVALTDVAALQVMRGDGRGGLIAGDVFAVGAGPVAVAAGDLDGDGEAELATADALADTVTVVVDGAARSWPVPRQPTGLAVVRGEHGGIGVLSEGTGEVMVLDPWTGSRVSGATSAAPLGLAGGEDGLVVGGDGQATRVVRAEDGLTFAPLWPEPVALSFTIPIDVDGDGIDELVSGAGITQWMYGADGRAIGELTMREIDVQAGNVRGQDLDGDGRVDLVLVGALGDQVGIAALLQGSDGGFTAQEPVEIPGERIDGMAVGDMDGDAIADVVVLVRRDPEGTDVWFAAGDGDGGFAAAVRWASIESVVLQRLVTADLDGDAFMDLVGLYGGTSFTPGLVAVQNPGLEWTMDARPLAGASEWGDVQVVELDGDGEMDAVVCNTGGVLVIRRLVSVGLETVTWVTDAPCMTMSARDVEGDGDVDVVMEGFSFDSTTIALLRNDGSGILTLASRQVVSGTAYGATFAELDGEPAPDLLVSGLTGTMAYRGASGPVLLEEEAVTLATEVEGRFADFNEDGRMDRVQIGAGIAVAFATESGRFGPWRHTPLAAVVDEDVVEVVDHAVFDVDGDGAAELVVLGTIDGALPLRAVSVVEVDEDGGLRGQTVGRLALDAYRVLARDLDGDGLGEIVMVVPEAEGATVGLLRGADGYASVQTQRVELPMAYSTELVGLYDMGGDRVLDLVVRTTTELLVAPGEGDGSFARGYRWGRIDDASDVVIADVDGDRAADVLKVQGLAVESPPRLVLVRGDRSGHSAGTAVRVRSRVERVAVADLDGDSIKELVTGLYGPDEWEDVLEVGRATGDGRWVFNGQALPQSLAVDLIDEIAVHTFDADDRPDIAVVDAGGFTIVRQRP